MRGSARYSLPDSMIDSLIYSLLGSLLDSLRDSLRDPLLDPLLGSLPESLPDSLRYSLNRSMLCSLICALLCAYALMFANGIATQLNDAIRQQTAPAHMDKGAAQCLSSVRPCATRKDNQWRTAGGNPHKLWGMCEHPTRQYSYDTYPAYAQGTNLPHRNVGD